MVPVVTEEKKQGNPLRVYVEPYNILPVDKAAFKGEIPTDVKNLYPYQPFNMFIQRKLFMHNMSHATCAYLGYLRNYEYIYEAVADFDIKYVAFKALTQSALAVAKENGVEIEQLLMHAENLLYRFTNKALADTVERVGKDTIRKLSANDRLIGALNLAEKHGVGCEFICLGIAAAMAFDPQADERSVEVSNFASENGAKATLEKYCQYTGKMADLIETLYNMIKKGKQISALVKVCETTAGKEIRV